jgi:predicted LPLAT superfamily acyltransferase
MQNALLFAQTTNLPEGGGGAVFTWLLLAGGIVALWLMIRNTRKKAYRDYWERKQRDEARRLNDPDMAKPESGDDGRRTSDDGQGS